MYTFIPIIELVHMTSGVPMGICYENGYRSCLFVGGAYLWEGLNLDGFIYRRL